MNFYGTDIIWESFDPHAFSGDLHTATYRCSERLEISDWARTEPVNVRKNRRQLMEGGHSVA